VLEREGDGDVPDPYVDYFGSGVIGGITGGLRPTPPVLDATPYAITVDLNDWRRFDRAGTYRLYLKSHRLLRLRQPGEPRNATIPFAAVSNVIEVRILPEDTAWAAAKLRQIESVLVQPEPRQPVFGDPPTPVNPIEAQLREARRDLRYLASAEAVRLALADARKVGTSPDTLLLIGARDRQQAIAAFDRYLADPEITIRAWDIQVRALFTFLAKESPEALPLFAWQFPRSGIRMRLLQARAAARHKRFQKYLRAEALRLIPVVAAKQQTAREPSGEAIAAIVPEAARAAQLVPSADYGLSRDELVRQFPDFPAKQQAELLGGGKWDLIRGPAIIPALQQVVDAAPPGELPLSATLLHTWGGIDGGVPEAALRRLHELAPQEPARILAEHLARGNARFAGYAVRELPAFDIPEADDTFLRWLRDNKMSALPLIAKFATSRLTFAMRERYFSRSWPCTEEAAFLTYFLRSRPTTATPDDAAALLREAMANREKRGCHRSLLAAIAQILWDPALQAQALASLEHDADAETVATAVRVLAAHGGPDVEPFLWNRLARWSQHWRGRTDEWLGEASNSQSAAQVERRLGDTLYHGIASAKSWPLDETRRQRLHSLCPDEQCRNSWRPTPRNTEIRVEVSNGAAFYPPAFQVAGYRSPTLIGLKHKLLQYPRGTVFRWCPQPYLAHDAFSPGQREEMFVELQTFLTPRSLRIEPFHEAKCLPAPP
jgi:hypothetical protein